MLQAGHPRDTSRRSHSVGAYGHSSRINRSLLYLSASLTGKGHWHHKHKQESLTNAHSYEQRTRRNREPTSLALRMLTTRQAWISEPIFSYFLKWQMDTVRGNVARRLNTIEHKQRMPVCSKIRSLVPHATENLELWNWPPRKKFPYSCRPIFRTLIIQL